MAGGINNLGGAMGNDAGLVLKNLQLLINANPAYLTSGIPTHLIQQMYMNEPPKVINKRPTFDVCYDFLLFHYILCFKLLIFYE